MKQAILSLVKNPSVKKKIELLMPDLASYKQTITQYKISFLHSHLDKKKITKDKFTEFFLHGQKRL